MRQAAIRPETDVSALDFSAPNNDMPAKSFPNMMDVA
jgi:hypothetical protein